jgi:hypothetical protein
MHWLGTIDAEGSDTECSVYRACGEGTVLCAVLKPLITDYLCNVFAGGFMTMLRIRIQKEAESASNRSQNPMEAHPKSWRLIKPWE